MSPTNVDSESSKDTPSDPEDYDLICVGFGPASLAIAVALQDLHVDARVLFLERQPEFAWHAGMLIPTAKMQISFLKDLATFRDPRSHFTFLNYLKHKGRLEAFANLGTFLPLREEFNDYLAWAAEHFRNIVKYGTEVQKVHAVPGSPGSIVKSWTVSCLDIADNRVVSFMAKKIVIAVGGSPKLPRGLYSFGPRIIHSSKYLEAIRGNDWMGEESSKFAVIGGGQSAAEIFENLMARFPKAQVQMFMTGSALKPSDDSPFVNEIFNPDRVDQIYALNDADRYKVIADNRPTNYSVVRAELLDRLYDSMYHQRLREPDMRKWRFQIHGSRELCEAIQTEDGRINLQFVSRNSGDKQNIVVRGFDLVFVGTGYTRNAHVALLEPIQHLLEGSSTSVERDYRLKFKEGAIEPDCGIWLQGCCEASHGLSDSLLSILAVRGAEMVESIFGEEAEKVSPLDKSNGLANGFH